MEDLWVTPNSQNVEYTGTSVSISSIKQNSEIIRLKQQTEDSCQITLTIPITLDTNAVKVLPIDCYNTTQYIRYENDSLYFSSDMGSYHQTVNLFNTPSTGKIFVDNIEVTGTSFENNAYYDEYVMGNGYQFHLSYNFSIGTEVFSPNCSTTFYVLGENCDSSYVNGNCGQCITGYYYLENDNTKCVDPSTIVDISEYYYNSPYIKRCYQSCATCSVGGNSTYHNCLTCKDGYFFITVNTTKNCVSSCAGKIVNNECFPVIPTTTNTTEDEAIVVEVPPADIVQSLDSLGVNLNNMEGNNEVKGEGFTLQVYETYKDQV